MSEFKFTAQERADIVGVDRNSYRFNIEKLLDRIEQIISARGESDGWVSDDELDKEYPSTIAQIGRKLTDEEAQEGIFFDNFYKKEGAKWMRSKLFPSPPKPDQQ